jgi:hypothetical protein
MEFCNKCKIPFEGIICPVCEAKRELKLKDRFIEQILKNNEILSQNKILNINQVARAISRRPATIYQDRCKNNDLNIPFKKNGKKLTISIVDLKVWAKRRDENLNLVDI